MLGVVTSLAYVAAFGGVVYVTWTGLMALIGHQKRMRILKKLPYSEKYHWLLGHLYYLPGLGEEGTLFLRESAQDFPHLTLVFNGPFLNTVNIRHPDTLRPILKTSAPKPRWFGGYFAARPWLGEGLLISGGDKWARNRRLLTPAFHFDILKPYVAVKNQATELLMEKWQRHAEAGTYMEAFSDVSLLTLDIILRCAFSYENDCQTQGEQHPYVKAVNALGRGLMERMLRPWLYPDWIFYRTSRGKQFKANCDFVHTVSWDVIVKRRQSIAAASEPLDRNRRYLDFLDILLSAVDTDGVGLTDQEIQDEVDTFMFEGHDTTASGISWALYELASHPEHMQRCQDEVDDILDGRPNDNLQWDDLGCLRYLTMCIKESMRLHTTVPLIERETTQEMTIDGYTIPAGTVIDINLYNLHHNPTVWDNSTEYRPSRFLPENMEKMDPYSFLPFSAGPRNCIGQHFAMDEMKIVMARIIRRFNLETDPDRPARQLMAMVMRTEFGMWMKVTPRSK